MQFTDKQQLKKPEQGDFYNIKDFNDNMDRLDDSVIIHYFDGPYQTPSSNKSDFKNIKPGDLLIENTTKALYRCSNIINNTIYWSKCISEEQLNVKLANEDTGWKTPKSLALHTDPQTHIPHSEFSAYSDASPLKIRKIKNIVFLEGIIKNYHEISSNEQPIMIFTLPDGFVPNQRLVFVQQGSGTNRFVLDIQTDGKCYIDRYSNGASVSNIPAGSWLNCFATWMVD